MTDPVLGSIILIEDEPTVRAMVSKQLTAKGYRVEEFSNAEDAIERMDRGNSICLVITDITLPGKNGIELARWVRENHPMVPIIFLTGDPTKVEGPNHVVIAKPFRDPREITDTAWQQIKEGLRRAEVQELKDEFGGLKGDFGTCLDKLSEVSDAVGTLSSQFQAQLALAAAERAKQDAQLVLLGSQAAAAVRTADGASVKADNANVKVDNISIPTLVTGWRAKWDPILTGFITVMFMLLSYLVTEYKDQIIEKATGVDKKVKTEMAVARAETKTEIARVQTDVGELRDQVKRDSIDNKRRQLSIEVSQHALAHNMDKILDKLSVPPAERAPTPVLSSPSPDRPELPALRPR